MLRSLCKTTQKFGKLISPEIQPPAMSYLFVSTKFHPIKKKKKKEKIPTKPQTAPHVLGAPKEIP